MRCCQRAHAPIVCTRCRLEASLALRCHINAPRSGALIVAVGFNPRFRCSPTTRVAQRRLNACFTDFRRRSATRYQFRLASNRGLKPTATIKPSLRDGPSRLRTVPQVAGRPARPAGPSERARASQSRISNSQTIHCTCSLVDSRVHARQSSDSPGRWPVGFGASPKPPARVQSSSFWLPTSPHAPSPMPNAFQSSLLGPLSSGPWAPCPMLHAFPSSVLGLPSSDRMPHALRPVPGPMPPAACALLGSGKPGA